MKNRKNLGLLFLLFLMSWLAGGCGEFYYDTNSLFNELDMEAHFYIAENGDDYLAEVNSKSRPYRTIAAAAEDAAGYYFKKVVFNLAAGSYAYPLEAISSYCEKLTIRGGFSKYNWEQRNITDRNNSTFSTELTVDDYPMWSSDLTFHIDGVTLYAGIENRVQKMIISNSTIRTNGPVFSEELYLFNNIFHNTPEDEEDPFTRSYPFIMVNSNSNSQIINNIFIHPHALKVTAIEGGGLICNNTFIGEVDDLAINLETGRADIRNNIFYGIGTAVYKSNTASLDYFSHNCLESALGGYDIAFESPQTGYNITDLPPEETIHDNIDEPLSSGTTLDPQNYLLLSSASPYLKYGAENLAYLEDFPVNAAGAQVDNNQHIRTTNAPGTPPGLSGWSMGCFEKDE